MKPREYLEENGPSTVDETPDVKPIDKFEDNVQKMALRGSQGSINSKGRQKQIYYLPEHDPKLVVSRYLQANKQLIEHDRRVITGLFARQGQKYKKAWIEIAEEIQFEGHKRGDVIEFQTNMIDCGICGEPMRSSSYPAHIRKDHSA